VLVTVAMLGGSAALGAQDSRIQRKSTIVIPQEVLAELQRVAREAFGEVQLGDLSREIARAMADLSRDLGHFGGAAFVDGLVLQDRDFRAEQTDKQTRTLAIGANGSLELRNVVGDIRVKAGGSREATVEIVRVSRGRTDADARLGLERVTASVTTRGERGTVSVEYPNERRPNYAVSVSMTVTAPAGTELTVHSVTGDVTIAGIKGEVTANTTTGGLDISQAANVALARTVTGRLVIRDSQSEGTLEAGTMSGSVQLSNIKARRLEINSVTASIVARDIEAGGADVTCMSGQIEYTGPVVSGGRYEFQAHNGEIRLGLTGGFDFEGQTFSGQIDADAALGLKNTPTNERAGFGMRRQSLKGTVGNGGAFVEATTFSGHIRLGRTVQDGAGRGRGGR
jgi:DUF4097 and DUF4098 domain-containing protein YvlB